MSVVITALDGSLTYQVNGGVPGFGYDADSNITSLVDAAGNEVISSQSVIVRMTSILTAGGAYSILINSDSTGYGVTRWPYLLCAKLATIFPAATILYRQFDDSTDVWPAPTVYQSGTTGTLLIQNGAISGSVPLNLQGSKRAVFESVGADLFILNHGHNISASWTTIEARCAEMLNAIEPVVSELGPVPVLLVAQNAGTTLLNETKALATKALGPLIGANVADVYSAFLAAGNGADLQDTVHPTDAAGSPLFATVILEALKKAFTPLSRNPPNAATQLISNANLSIGSANALPTGYTSSNVTFTDVTADGSFESGTRALSMIATTGSGSAWLRYSLTSDQRQALKGQTVLFAARMKVAASSPSTVGQIDISVGGASAISATYPATTRARGAFRWTIVAVKVPIDATTIQMLIYADSSTTPTTTPEYALVLDRVVACAGNRLIDII